MDRTYVLEFARVTEMAAIEAAKWVGKGDKHAADGAAVDAMRRSLDLVNADATVVIGEGERDEAPMLFIGERVGNGNGPELEIAVDPLEGTNLCASGSPNSIAVMAIGEKGSLLHAPDVYMNKLVVGQDAAEVVDITKTPTENLQAIARAKRMAVNELTVIILDRPRHEGLIKEVRTAGARIHLISDGDVSAGVAAVMPGSGIDALMGVGAAPEGVITAAAVRCLGGMFQGQLRYTTDTLGKDQGKLDRASKIGASTDEEKVYFAEDLAAGDVIFCATGVTTGEFLQGVKYLPDGKIETHSIVMRSRTKTVREIIGRHTLDYKPELQ